MGRKIDIDIKEMLDKIQQLIITQEDCGYIFKTKERTDEFYRLYGLYQQGNYNIKLIEDFLIDNSDDINKENLMLVLAKNCKYQILGIEEQLREEERRQVTSDKEVKMKMTTISVGNKQKKMIEETLRYVQQNAKGIDRILTFYRQDNEKKTYTLDVADSRELIDKKHVSSVKNLKRFEKIDNAFEDDKDNIGIGYILQVINLSDLKEIFPSLEDNDESTYIEESETEKIARESKKKRFGIDVMRLIYDRKILREGILSYEELRKIKSKYSDKYNKILETMKDDNFTPYIKEVVREYIKYVDMDKLLLIAAYRFNYGLEGIEDKRKTTGYEEIVKIILDNIENSKAEIFCNLEYDWNGKLVMAEAEYSVDKLKRFASKFVDNQYISEREIQASKEKIQNQEYLLKNIDPRYIDIMFSIEEQEQYANLNIENFEFVAERLKWDKAKIIEIISSQDKCSTNLLKDLIGKRKIHSNSILELYMNNKVTLKQIEELKGQIDLSAVINSYELIQYYNNSIENDTNEKEKKKFDKYIDVYKKILINNKKEELEESYDELVNTLLDNYKGEEYIKAAGCFYKNGLIPIEVLVEWNGEEIVEKMFNSSMIEVEELKHLSAVGVISSKYINRIYDEMAMKEGLTQEERVDILKSGFCSKSIITKLYLDGLIGQEDLNQLSQKCIISEEEKEKLKSSLTLEKAESNSLIVLQISNSIDKIKNLKRHRDTEEIEDDKEKSKIIINPEIREAFIELLGAQKCVIDKNKPLSKDNPFYNYEFYAIPDENGEITLDSVIIAERYYEDRKTEKRFATKNATYFFRYGDLMVLSKYARKDEVIDKKENVIFRASHTVANERNDGHWATSVIENLIKATLSSDLKGYNKEDKAMLILEEMIKRYDMDTLRKIYKMEKDIDSGEHLYEIIRGEKETDLDLSEVDSNGDGR